MENYLRIFKALSHKTRLRIVNLFLSSDVELCVCEIVDSLRESQYNISKHLKELKYAGLIEEKKIGKWVSYSLTSDQDEFFRNIFKAIAGIPAAMRSDDLEMLLARLSLRQEGKCILGLRTKQWEKIKKALNKQGRS